MKLKTTLIALSLTALTLPAFADTPAPKNPNATPGIDKRIDNQEKRIEQGEKSGALTTREAGRMEKRNDKAEADLAAAKADGKVTKDERKDMHQELNRDSHAIHHQKHDRQHDFNHDGKTDRPHRHHHE